MLKNVLSKIVKAAITIGERQLDKIGNPLLKRLVLIFIGAGEEVILALLDGDKDNEKQLLAVVHKNAATIIKLGGEIGREKLATLKDINLAQGITIYLNGVEEVMAALVDDNPDNEAQIKAIWERHKLGIKGETVEIATDKVADIIRSKIKDPIIANIIIEVLQSVSELIKQSDNLIGLNHPLLSGNSTSNVTTIPIGATVS